ncbi:MAG: hypothetical protein K2Q20_15205 [Phycisphaerales bacterium]|nr:hypothetical protein [Phycisphaerales bacterium]
MPSPDFIQTPPEPPPPRQDTDFGGLAQDAAALLDALRDVITHLPGQAHGTRELARALGIDKSLASRVLGATRATDALAGLAQLPGPAPLAEMLKAARKRGAPAPLVQRAEALLESYRATLKSRFEDRAGLNAVLSAALPEARHRFEIAARQAIFRGTAAVKGISAEVSSVTFLMHPGRSAETGLCESVMVGGYIGLRRVRPQTRMLFSVVPRPLGLPTPASVEPNHAPDPQDLHGVLLREFCTPRDMGFNCEPIDNGYRYEVRGDQVGTASSVDLYLAERYPNHLRVGQRPPNARTRRIGATIEIPTRRLIIDAVIHKDLFPNARLELRAYDTAFRGRVEPPAPERDLDLLPLVESIRDYPRGIADLRSSRLPRFVELLEHVCDRMSWNPREFRAHRCEMQYPMYGAQVMMLLHAD